MNADHSDPGEERLTSLVLAYQEAVEAGTPLPDPLEHLTDPDLLARWHKARAGLDLLARARPEAGPGAGRSVLERVLGLDVSTTDWEPWSRSAAPALDKKPPELRGYEI